MNIKQKTCMYVGAGLFVLALFSLAQLSGVHGPAFKLVAVISVLLGVFCVLGTWSLGLARSADPENDEAMNAIK